MTEKTPTTRPPLSRDRVLAAALDLADRHGLEALTMRRLGSELGVEAMSLYKHVAGKDEILDGIVELVLVEIELPPADVEWKDAMRERARSVRDVFRRHAWAIGLLESRSGGRAAAVYVDAIIGVLRSAGFTVDDAAHAFWLLDSYVYGHVVQETSITGTPPGDGTEEGAGDLPHLAELTRRAAVAGFQVDTEFEFGLELILDGLERVRSRD